jgi:hypothetical protein
MSAAEEIMMTLKVGDRVCKNSHHVGTITKAPYLERPDDVPPWDLCEDVVHVRFDGDPEDKVVKVIDLDLFDDYLRSAGADIVEHIWRTRPRSPK